MPLTIPKIRKVSELKPLFILLIVVAFALGISFIFNNYMLFLFFVFSTLSKFILVKDMNNIKTQSKLKVLIGISLIFSALLSIFLSGIGNNFPEQQELLRNKIIETGTRHGGSISGEIVDNPAFILLWGVLYYFLLTVFQSFSIITFPGTKVEPDSEEYIKRLRKRKK